MKYKLAKKERAALAARFPTLMLDTDETGGRVTGIMEVMDGVGYTVNLVFSTNYPDDVPELFCREEEIDWILDRHALPGANGRACLCVRSEYRKHWPLDSTLADFLDALVRPYFVGQAYYDAHGFWPLDRERSHGVRGIIEAYEDFIGLPIGKNHGIVIAFMKLVAMSNHPRGTTLCPCGSGLQLRRCHGKLVARLRGTIHYRDAAWDLAFMRSFQAQCERKSRVAGKSGGSG